jgi:aldehyde dehydrogenase (NAD+)
MRDYAKISIDGAWVASAGGEAIDVINPASQQPAGQIALGIVFG